MSAHAAIKAMREWWSAEARQAFTEIAQEMLAAGVTEEQIGRWLRRLYDAAARDEAEGGDGVRLEAVSLRVLQVETQVGHTEEGEAILEKIPTLELRSRRLGEWKSLLSRPLADIVDAGKLSMLWDAEGLS